MKEPRPLEDLYAEALQAIRAKDHGRAAELLRPILIADENFKDTSQLLARVVRAKRRRWYNDARLWAALGIAALVGSGVWLSRWLPERAADPPTLPPGPIAALPTAIPPTDPPATPLDTPVPAPTAIPLAWKRLYGGLEFARDTVTAIVLDPTDPDVLYVGTESAGVYKSIDGGDSWSPIHNGLLRARVDSLFMDPNDPQVIYVGVRNGGVYRTTNGGQHWKALNLGITDLDSDNPAMVDGSRTDGGEVYFSHGFSFYRLAHQSWFNRGLSFITTHFAVHPDDGSRLFVIAAQYQDSLGQGPPRLYRSEDSGMSMHSLGSPPAFSSGEAGFSWQDRLFYGVDAGGQERLYVLRPPFIHGSTDGGRNWAATYRCYSAVVDPQGSLVAACDGRLVRTSNGGRTWGSLSQLPLETQSVRAIAFSVTDPNVIFLGGEGGLYASLDGGKTWEERNKGLGAGWLELTVHPSSPSAVFVQEGNCFQGRRDEYPLRRSTDGGGSWDLLPVGGCGVEIGADGQTLYRAFPAEGAVYRSTDGGQTWVGWPLRRACNSPGITAHPSETGVAYVVGPWAICLTRDAGRSWDVMYAPEGTWGPLEGAKLYLSALEGRMYSALSPRGMLQSYSDGVYWRECSPQVSSPPTEARLAVDPRDSDRLLLATLGRGVWISENGCASWQKGATGIRGQFVNAVVIDPRQPSIVYAGTDNGAFVSFDGGETWAPINDGLLGALVVYSIAIDSQGNVYAATPYGIFRLEAR